MMKNSTYLHFGVFVLCLFFGSSAICQTLYVATNGDNSNGQTWQSAYTTIQAAVTAAADNDTILVGSSGTGHGDGLYIENIDINKPLTLESEAGYATTIIQAANSGDHAVYVISTQNVTVCGFSVFGATLGSPVYAAGIYVRDSSYCTVENNRCGWNDGTTYSNYKGIRLDISDHCLITNNYVGYNTYCGIYMGYWASTAYRSRYNTISYNTCDQASNSILAQSSSHDNTIVHNTCINGAGITMSNCNFNYLAFNECIGSGGDGFSLSMCNDNVIANNLSTLNNYGGIKISGSGAGHYNTLANNILTNNTYRAIYFSQVYDNIAAGNICSGNGNESVRFTYGGRNRFFLNSFGHSTVYTGYSSTNLGSTPTAMAYFASPAHHNYMGNYYVHFTGTDTDGDGISETPYTTAYVIDNYPLMNPPDQYNLQAWFLNDSGKMFMAFDRAPATVEIPAGGSAVWCSKLPASADADYPAASWNGQLRFTAAVSETDITIDVGYADTDGSSFVASGPTGQPSSSTAITTYSTTAQALTIPQGKSLAMRITNAAATPAEMITGGAWSYLTAPAGSTVIWSDSITGDIAGDEGVDLVDYAYLVNRWGRTDCATTDNCEGADLDGLGSVDIEDLRIMVENWLLGK